MNKENLYIDPNKKNVVDKLVEEIALIQQNCKHYFRKSGDSDPDNDWEFLHETLVEGVRFGEKKWGRCCMKLQCTKCNFCQSVPITYRCSNCLGEMQKGSLEPLNKYTSYSPDKHPDKHTVRLYSCKDCGATIAVDE